MKKEAKYEKKSQEVTTNEFEGTKSAEKPPAKNPRTAWINYLGRMRVKLLSQRYKKRFY